MERAGVGFRGQALALESALQRKGASFVHRFRRVTQINLSGFRRFAAVCTICVATRNYRRTNKAPQGFAPIAPANHMIEGPSNSIGTCLGILPF